LYRHWRASDIRVSAANPLFFPVDKMIELTDRATLQTITSAPGASP
jgi:hypothetical protein